MTLRRELPFLPEVTEEVYLLRAEVVDKCEECGGTGYVPAGQGKVYRCDCMILFRYLKELTKARIPRDYWRLDIKSLKINASIKKYVITYIRNMARAKSNGLGFVLYGQNGIGKTSLMAEIGKAAIVRGYKVRYFTLSSYITAMYNHDDDRIANMESGEILLIDELDKQSEGKNLTKNVDEFLRRMFNTGKSLVLATNWSETELADALGESTNSLLKRRCQFLTLSGGDYSDELQKDFFERLTSDYNYWDTKIMARASKLETVTNG